MVNRINDLNRSSIIVPKKQLTNNYENDIIFIAVASKKMTTEIKNKKSVDKGLKA